MPGMRIAAAAADFPAPPPWAAERENRTGYSGNALIPGINAWARENAKNVSAERNKTLDQRWRRSIPPFANPGFASAAHHSAVARATAWRRAAPHIIYHRRAASATITAGEGRKQPHPG